MMRKSELVRRRPILLGYIAAMVTIILALQLVEILSR